MATKQQSVYTQPRIKVDRREGYAYDKWLDSLGLPVHRGYFIEDLREIEVAPWEEFGCNAAFVQLEGMQGITEARVTEIPPGGTMPATKFMLDEVVFCVAGHGITTVWADDGPKHTFEWGPRSLF